MELISATDLQFNSRPVMEAWLGNNLIWGRGVIWTGLGFNNNWSNTSNWYEAKVPPTFSSIQFTGTTRLSTYNDFSIDRPVNDITFNASSGSFQLSGNRFILSTGGITNNSVNAQTINNDIKLSSEETYINCNTGNITFNGLLSGSSSIVKTGNSKANVSVARTISTGSVTVSAGTLQFDNLTTNGGADLMDLTPSVFNLNGDGTTLIFNSAAGSARARVKTYNFSSFGNQTINYVGGIYLNNDSTFITNGGPKNYINGGTIDGQTAGVFYNVANGTDDVDLEISSAVNRQAPTKTGNGKLSFVNNSFNIGLITILNGTFDIGGTCSLPNIINTIANDATFSYSSSNNSNCSLYTLSGTGNLIKSGTSSLTLSSSRCTYTGSTSILDGSIVTTKNTATATFTPTTLTINFSTPPNIGDTFRFFSGSTIQSYASVSLIGAPARTASYNSSISTLTIDS